MGNPFVIVYRMSALSFLLARTFVRVTLYDGSTPVELCAETLPAGSGDSAGFSCALTANQLDVGSYSNVDAVYFPAGAVLSIGWALLSDGRYLIGK